MTVEPPETLTDPRVLLTGYLDYYRDALLRKLDGMPDDALRTSRLPSGWTPLGLLKHLAYVERRWLRWGFAAEQLDVVRADRPDGAEGFQAAESDTLADLKAFFLAETARTREVIAAADLQDTARSGGAFDEDEEHPTLIWILFHLLQEYARHVGQLDIVRELADGSTGE